MALSFIGKPISLISHSDVRYRGILAGIDPAASTIQLSRVYSMGTESRRPPAEFIPPVQEPYEYIIFRASEVKDLAVDEPAPSRSVHDDPAVLGASSAATPAPVQSYPYPPGAPAAAYAAQQAQQQQRPPSAVAQQPQVNAQAPNAATAAGARNQPPRRANAGANNNVSSAAASMETVERALGDLRVSNANGAGRAGGGGRRGPKPQPAQISVPNTDFDFQSSNARFDKKSGESGVPKKEKEKKEANGNGEEDVETNPSENGDTKGKDSMAYNPQKSFFDSLTPGPAEARGQAGGRGRRGGGMGGRNRREEEREKNVATFGEPGGVGLLGPGAYVGGWGGYGRSRGGGRGGRRGAPRGGLPSAAAVVGARS
ncbi:hypothetical protein VKT23_012956 [Stygiomarasmius scandens]|uniref:Uncharacterized protein n=1 Tax=Marasmiellus scandens TaxID=2682957 RepID=A0ABR1J5H2_9AGAR